MIDEKIRGDFPIFSKRKGKFVYFDNACTTLKPQSVIDAVTGYYSEYSGCAGRSIHRLSKDAEEHFEKSRGTIAKFVGAKPGQVVFTKNSSEAMNLVVSSLDYPPGSSIVTTIFEHHSALLPCMRLRDSGRVALKVAKPHANGVFDEGQITGLIDKKTRLVVMHASNNSLGHHAPVREVIKAAHDSGSLVLLDCAQSVPHSSTDFSQLGADFIAFSGHKMLGPTGIGCLVAKSEHLERMQPFLVGGETIESVSLDEIVWAKPPHKFEAGIQHYSGAIGLAAACNYLSGIGLGEVERHERQLGKRAYDGLASIPGVTLYGSSDYSKRAGVVTFNVGNASPHEVAITLDSLEGICVRSGIFCAEPAMGHLGAPNGAVRASLYLYNTVGEVDKFVETVRRASQVFA